MISNDAATTHYLHQKTEGKTKKTHGFKENPKEFLGFLKKVLIMVSTSVSAGFVPRPFSSTSSKG
jgi:hypothetical protein